MSYADMAAKGPKQSPEEAQCLPIVRFAPTAIMQLT
ncbi:hypothetical protein SNOG_05961 [Parastagonospora nodorum SN15]|uniref:Uncharacterized protein n=1 Tax=Phaeosphaeria nodorum (strain SN15 / ATCC MYA-4574 / FGSC 10173) TaxID=321614 RepID=Q0UQK3_PHANO|nr:hypothetical protein SNOG_05961 [Parastagonospora nodorum SN15]EAT87025.1 hypothetical protein SNOG_05961 [Parastagonospora nodorum SN15]